MIKTTMRDLSVANASGVLAKLSDAPFTSILGYRIYKITQSIIPELAALEVARVAAVDALGLTEGTEPTPEQEAQFFHEMAPVLDDEVTLDVKPLNVSVLAQALDKADYPLTGREWGIINFMLEE